ncbi:DBH-like monooxygenase protein 1 isoform X1 [Dreissena polymorpha]|uniref:DOMON domain-containing protein n=1 Tax=Dreissena polymorpha TaxID=45954 RepID=A0A9D4FMB6_DREPO|nr:DBH-like monooxygenase protein 1 isoform X1 [Dreissena polymorpha]KAH3799813.1 hypothetical protein DPMN_153429 [Dreissena polymorpha]
MLRLGMFAAFLMSVGVVWGQMPDRTPNTRYPYVTDMDHEGAYVLRWGLNATHIWFEVQVKTLGYVGFGISRDGRMVPADVIIGWVAGNQVHFQDYHTERYEAPTVDSSQDWLVDYGYEEAGWTVLGFTRALDTCDTLGDFKITRDTQRLIYAYHTEDPDVTSPNPLIRHTVRGRKSVSLMTTSHPPAELPIDSSVIDFTNDNFSIPVANTSTYNCRLFDLSDVNVKYHIIKMSPVFSPGMEQYVDHMVLYRCRIADPASLLVNGASFNCFSDAPDHVQFCREHVASFGHRNKEDFYLPEDVGIPIGGTGESNLYVLATHYVNELQTPNLVDSSGIQLTYTADLRTNDAAFLSMGNIISPNWLQYIPPGEPSFQQRAYCSERCIQWGMNSTQNALPMTVVGAKFHSHDLATEMKLRHVTKTSSGAYVENPWLAYDGAFDSDQQAFRVAEKRRNVSFTDHLMLECTYDSSTRGFPTLGGWHPDNELCRAYVLYYPRKMLEGCMSWSNYDQLRNQIGQPVNGSDVFNTLLATDWSNNNVMRVNLKHALQNSIENAQCWSSRQDPSYAVDWFQQTDITIQTPYQPTETRTCV